MTAVGREDAKPCGEYNLKEYRHIISFLVVYRGGLSEGAPMRSSSRIAICAVALSALALATAAEATNTPCSGRKGGIDYCRSGKFVCKDGSTSASKKTCTAPGRS